MKNTYLPKDWWWGAFLLLATISGFALLFGGKPFTDFIGHIIAHIGW